MFGGRCPRWAIRVTLPRIGPDRLGGPESVLYAPAPRPAAGLPWPRFSGRGYQAARTWPACGRPPANLSIASNGKGGHPGHRRAASTASRRRSYGWKSAALGLNHQATIEVTIVPVIPACSSLCRWRRRTAVCARGCSALGPRLRWASSVVCSCHSRHC
jgi:hypothetical protein